MKRDEALERSYGNFALIMTVNCVRNTIIEDFHAAGKLTQADMKAFNKQVANKLFTWLYILDAGTEEEREALMRLGGLFYPAGWDKPVFDKGIIQAVTAKLT